MSKIFDYIAESVKSGRARKKMTAKELADHFNIHIDSVYRIENGRARPSLEMADNMLNYLGQSVTMGTRENEDIQQEKQRDAGTSKRRNGIPGRGTVSPEEC